MRSKDLAKASGLRPHRPHLLSGEPEKLSKMIVCCAADANKDFVKFFASPCEQSHQYLAAWRLSVRMGRLDKEAHEVEVFVGEGFFQPGEVHVVGVVGLFCLRVVKDVARLVGRGLMFVHGDSVVSFCLFYPHVHKRRHARPSLLPFKAFQMLVEGLLEGYVGDVDFVHAVG